MIAPVMVYVALLWLAVVLAERELHRVDGEQTRSFDDTSGW